MREEELDPLRWAKHDNQPSNVLVLIAKAMKKLMDRRTLRGVTERGRKTSSGRGGRNRTVASRHEIPKKRK